MEERSFLYPTRTRFSFSIRSSTRKKGKSLYSQSLRRLLAGVVSNKRRIPPFLGRKVDNSARFSWKRPIPPFFRRKWSIPLIAGSCSKFWLLFSPKICCFFHCTFFIYRKNNIFSDKKLFSFTETACFRWFFIYKALFPTRPDRGVFAIHSHTPRPPLPLSSISYSGGVESVTGRISRNISWNLFLGFSRKFLCQPSLSKSVLAL